MRQHNATHNLSRPDKTAHPANLEPTRRRKPFLSQDFQTPPASLGQVDDAPDRLLK
jgi:hypothetical protein